MALTAKGQEILAAMRKTYGPKANHVFYGAVHNGTITGTGAPGDKGARGKARGGRKRGKARRR